VPGSIPEGAVYGRDLLSVAFHDYEKCLETADFTGITGDMINTGIPGDI